MGGSESPSTESYGVVVMGSSKVGKTSFIKGLLRLNDEASTHREKIENLFEYREYTLGKDIFFGPNKPPLRSRAIATGNVFILLFSMNDIKSYIFADTLRREIIHSKGIETPIILVGLGTDSELRLKDSSVFDSSDMLSCSQHSSVYNLALPDERVLKRIHEYVVCCQQDYYMMSKARLDREQLGIGQCIQKLIKIANYWLR